MTTTPASQALDGLVTLMGRAYSDLPTAANEFSTWLSDNLAPVYKALKILAAIESGELVSTAYADRSYVDHGCSKSHEDGNNDLLERLKKIGDE